MANDCQAAHTSTMIPEILLLMFVSSGCLFPSSSPAECESDSQKSSRAPSVSLLTMEYPIENVVPVGYNVTIICNSSSSLEDYGIKSNSMPYWVIIHHGKKLLNSCGGQIDKKEDPKICKSFIKNVTEGNSGKYTCRASNVMACTFKLLFLTVKEPSPPHLTIHPRGRMNVIANSQINLSCEATGVPRPAITWYKDGNPLTGANVRRDGNYSLLTKESVISQDQGKYWCEANNSEGWNRTKALNLSVIWKPFIEQNPRNVSVFVEGNATFGCSASGSPYPQLRWMKNNFTFMTNGSVFKIGNVSKLFVLAVKMEDTGDRYRCVAKNSLGEAFSQEGTLIVLKEARTHPENGSHTSDHDNRQSSILAATRSSKFLWPLIGTTAFIGVLVISLVILKMTIWKNTRSKKRTEMITGNEESPFPGFVKDKVNELRDCGLGSSGRTNSSRPEKQDATILNDEIYINKMERDRNWEISRERLQISDVKLGRGEFGVVNKGTYLRKDGNKLAVAVKTVKDTTDRSERLALIRELEMLIHVGRHPNVVSLVGVCTFEEPLCVVLEFVPGGSLEKLLRSSRVDPRTEDAPYANIWSRLSERKLLQIASGVASGMKHLETNQCVHRDLAARNILVSRDLVAKVADFGMSRDISNDGQYIQTTQGKVPWLWMAMEALRGLFTTKADVWSFGVVLWEIVTLGKRPYNGVNSIEELHSMLQDGVRLEKPSHCSQELYNIMLCCWQDQPSDRPTFDHLHKTLQDILNKEERTYINVKTLEEETSRRQKDEI